MRNFIFPVVIALVFISCTNNGNEEMSASGIERLMVYYPLDSAGPSGEKLFHTIPEAQLIAQDGKMYSTSALNGKVTVSDFFFASCGGTCPKMTSQLTRVQAAFRNNADFKIVSFSVDPTRDSAQALHQYAESFKADTLQWTFLTGEKKTIYDLARYGYFLPVAPGNGDSEDFIHSDQLILTDKKMHIRGYYSGTDSASVDSLIMDIGVLLKEK